MTADSWRRQLYNDMLRDEALYLKNQTQATQSQGLVAQHTEDILNEEQVMKVTNLSQDVQRAFDYMDKVQVKIQNVTSEITNKVFPPGKTEAMAKSDLLRYQQESDMAQTALNNKSRILTEYTSQLRKSDLFDFVTELIGYYDRFLGTLTLDQKVAIINLIGYFALLSTSISILIILGVNLIIKFLNLEEKYP